MNTQRTYTVDKPGPAAPLPACKICGADTTVHARAPILRKYQGTFLQCRSCGFIFFEKVDWLADAYAHPINLSDTGYVSRNLSCQSRMQMVIELFLNPTGKFLDYAAGYGLFVRLMRDTGYDFRWNDAFCQNLFARGFEEPSPIKGPFEAVTAFEVLEHLVDPLKEIGEIAPTTNCMIVSTALLPDPAPAPEDWVYYGLHHGQHVSFYTLKSLESIASRFGYTLSSDGVAFHIFSRGPISIKRLGRIDGQWWRRLIRRTRVRPSLTGSDRESVTPVD